MKILFSGMEITYKAKRTKTQLTVTETCAKCAFRGPNPLCVRSVPCGSDEYYQVTMVMPVCK